MNAPSRVADIQTYWNDAPPELSARCVMWMQRIQQGWRPNSRVSGFGYYESAEYYGVYIWELLHVIYPLLYRWAVDNHTHQSVVALRAVGFVGVD